MGEIVQKAYFEASDSYFVIRKEDDDARYQSYFQLRGVGFRRYCVKQHASLEAAQQRLSEALQNKNRFGIYEILERNKNSLLQLSFNALAIVPRYLGAFSMMLMSPKELDSSAKAFCFLAGGVQDKQQYKVYVFERDKIFKKLARQKLSYDEGEALIAQVCEDFNVKAPSLVHKQVWQSYYDFGANQIVLNTKKPSKQLVLHELAHCILDRLTGDSDQLMPRPVFHGSEFVKTMILLYSRYGDMDYKHLYNRATQEGLIGPQEETSNNPVALRMNKDVKPGAPLFI